MIHYAADPLDKLLREILDEIDARIVYQRRRQVKARTKPIVRHRRKVA